MILVCPMKEVFLVDFSLYIGFYYQYNTTKDSSVPENEIYGTAKTDENGFITWNIKRPWEATTTLRYPMILMLINKLVL